MPAEEIRAAEFDDFAGELDAEAVAIAGKIIQRKTGSFDPATFRDRYQEALIMAPMMRSKRWLPIFLLSFCWVALHRPKF